MAQYRDYECVEDGCPNGVGYVGTGPIRKRCAVHRASAVVACAVTGCGQPAYLKAKALCQRHANQHYYGLDPHSADDTRAGNACTVCGSPVPLSLKRGPAPKVCSPACREERARATYRETPSYREKLRQQNERQFHCVTCGAYLRSGGERGPKKFCPPCALAVRRAQPKHSTTRICEQEQCERPLQARGRCSAHYKVWLREQGRMGQSGWGPRRKANRAVRDQHIAATRTGINPTVARLLARDGTDCGWCRQPLDMTLTYPHRMYRTIDHVVPLSKGGEHSMDNTRLLHWTCNSARNNSDALTKSDAKSASQAA
jgi:5-methylcytosine-specific restriction endonuclease McrA